jgi:hypothetical protein
MPCSICREKGHNRRTCRALLAARSDVISKRLELEIAECKLADIERQWALVSRKKSTEELPEHATDIQLQSGSVAVPTSGVLFTESHVSSDSEFEQVSVPDTKD